MEAPLMETLSLSDYLRQTGGTRPMAVSRAILADVETPVSAYWKLAHDARRSFLLESVTGGEQVARYSIIGANPTAVLRSRGRTVTKETAKGIHTYKLNDGEDPLTALQREMPAQAPIQAPDLPPFAGGAVGMLSYDFVRFLERLGDGPTDDLELPEMAMMLVGTVVVFDHAKNLIHVVSLADGTEDGYHLAIAAIDAVVQRLKEPLPELPSGSWGSGEIETNMPPEQYQAAVAKVIQYVTQGDGQQMVPSMRFSVPVQAHPLTVYRSLRTINPSPYMFLIRFGDFELVGASPELHVSLHKQTARVRPIAGTRWRGKTPEEDAQLAEELLHDEKERAEHVMLVDLGRNDLGRVSSFGSVHVNELMVIEKYSHVMHIVSDVTGSLDANKSAYDLIRATFPAGTVSGSPKVRAMQIIDEVETTRRGSYAGAVGLIAASGEVDLCIALRTILMKGGKAYVQAGAGVVFDSDPAYEYQEVQNKARAALRAIEMAQRGL